MDTFLREYQSRLPLLVERYSTNRKIHVRDIRYVFDPKAGEAVGDERGNLLSEIVTDGRQIKGVVLEGKLADPVLEKRKTDVNFWRPDMRFSVTRKGSKFAVVNQDLASTNYYFHEVTKYLHLAHVPMTAGGAAAGTTLWFDERGHKAAVVTVVDVKPATRNGRACVEVRTKWDNHHGIAEHASTYLDPANDYITIAVEADWKKDFFTNKEFRGSSEIEYAPSAEGFPLPKFVRSTTQYKGQPVRKTRDLEFVLYERYVPSPEEFQLEKPFGLVTPAELPAAANPALSPPAPRRRVWPWVALAAGAVLAVVAALLLVRSRRAKPPGPPTVTPSPERTSGQPGLPGRRRPRPT